MPTLRHKIDKCSEDKKQSTAYRKYNYSSIHDESRDPCAQIYAPLANQYIHFVQTQGHEASLGETLNDLANSPVL